MSFEILLSLEHRRLARQYAARHVEHPRLAAYPTLRALVAKLTKTPKKPRPTKKQLAELRQERAALLCALLEAYQQGLDRLWEALVLTALTPMLDIVRQRFTGGDADEREGLFLAALGTVIRTVDPRRMPEKIFAIIWMKTKRRVTPQLRKEHAWCGVGFDVQADVVPDETVPCPEEFLLVDIVSEANGGEMARAHVPVGVLALSRRRIETYVAREFGCLPEADQRAIYERLRALKHKCRKLEGKTVASAPRPGPRAVSVPPESGARWRDDAPFAEEATAAANDAAEVDDPPEVDDPAEEVGS
jgi:hypothetical protein